MFTFLLIGLSCEKNRCENLSKFIIFDDPIPRTSSDDNKKLRFSRKSTESREAKSKSKTAFRPVDKTM